ncbi:hypothetical protein J4573_31245 [Actinomadura barringtoniae]|uniref:Uncharacterized protein n=1 Tax=Actinomadura barringtoniae TaxID=1427535 RepID=A0A939PG12_9ACTN|nr:hypothetical protein [Actinomadura barringtoniae]MBO2451603.1 hypothetical protein [Actinomadura barringtoniae]
MSTPSTPPPPSPGRPGTWAEFTDALRALYEWCGAPKYRTLTGRVTGLSPAAISNLIGRNPLSRPPETAALRFVEACLIYRLWPQIETELSAWKVQWDRLASQPQPFADAPQAFRQPPVATAPQASRPPLPPAPHGGSRLPSNGRDRALLIGVGALVVAAAVAVVVVVTSRHGDGTNSPGDAKGSKNPSAAPVNNPGSQDACQKLTGRGHTDVRTKTTWPFVFQCANLTNSTVYEHANSGVRIGFMYTEESWFVCWTHGQQHAGGNDIWYYTQADKSAGKPELEGWGFMPADRLTGKQHPNPGVTRQCTFS